MPDLKITIGGDATQLQSALKSAQSELGKTAIAANKMDSSLAKVGKTGLSSIFNLTEKLRDLQSAVFTEKDRGRIAAYNTQIKATQTEIAKLNALSVASGGAGAFSGIAAGAGKAFEGVRKLAYLLPGVGIAGLIGFATEPIIEYVSALFGATEKQKELQKQSEELAKATRAIFAESGKEAANVNSLIAVLSNQNESYKRRNDALKELQKIQPEYFGNLKLEQGAVSGLDDAYRAYLANFKTVIAAKILQARLEAAITKQIEKQGVAGSALGGGNKLGIKPVGNQNAEAAQKEFEIRQKMAAFNQRAADAEEKNIENLFKQLQLVSAGIKVPEFKVKEAKIKVDKVKVDVKKDEILAGLLRNRGKEVGGADLTITPVVAIEPIIKPGVFEERLAAYIKDNEIAKGFNEIIQNTIISGLSGLGESIGAALGGGGLEGLFTGLFKTIGGGLKELGNYLIKTYGLITIIDKIKFSNPVLGVLTGVALVALGSLIQAKVSSPKAFASGSRSTPGGTFLVGERGPERIFLPQGSRVQPNNEMTAYNGGSQVMIPDLRIDGSTFVIGFKRAEARMNRNGSVAQY